MDTGLKKFNRLVITKIIAVLLCLVCVATMAVQLGSSAVEILGTDINYIHCKDALRYNILGEDEDIWRYESFRSEYVSFCSLLADSITNYGDGSEETYNAIQKAEENQNKENIRKTKENLIKAAAIDSAYFLAALYSGDIELVSSILFDTDGGDSIEEYNTDDLGDILIYEDIRNGTYYYSENQLPDYAKRNFEDVEYDAIFYCDTNLTIHDYSGDTELKIADYAPGCYAFKVNDEVLKGHILNEREKGGYYPDYKSFRAAYDRFQQQLQTDFATARYFVRDNSGNVYTNIASLNSKSDSETIKEVFSSYGTYSYSADERTVLNDGTLYTDTFYDFYMNHYNGRNYETTTMTEAAVTETTASGQNTDFTDEYGVTVNETTLAVSEPVAATTVVYSISYYSDTASSESNYECYVAVDEVAESETCRFANLKSNISRAEEYIRDCLITCGIMGVLFVIAFVYLIIKAGRKQGSEEIHLMKGDRIFNEIRLVLDCGIGALALWCMYVVLSATKGRLMNVLVGILASVFALVFLDLVLFITRHIKNKSFWGNIIIVRLIKKIRQSYKKNIAGIKEKVLYTKELNKTVKIRTLIVIALNILVAGLGLWITLFDGLIGLLFIGIAFLFDLYVLYRGLKFTGGVSKLFDFVKEMREGNLDIEINKNALPDYLMLPAENLQCLNEGLKDAVTEAIKQERTKTELITNVSHDLKTPLTSIINYVDLLKKCDIDDETAVSYLNILSEKSDRLKALIEDLVEASKASAGTIPVNFVSVSLKELLNQMLGEFEESFEEKKLQMIIDMPEEDIKVRADSKLIYRVLENLFVNIKKYAMENTRVYITLSEKGDRGTVNLKNISAAPLNISADELKERFVRGEQSRTAEGNGLGLSIAENFCTLQNGSMKIEINGDLFSVTVEMEKAKDTI